MMKTRTIRNILIWLGVFVALAAVTVFAAKKYLEPGVKNLFVSEINKSLTAEVQVTDIRLSLFRDFPFASVRFSGVKMKEAIPEAKNQDLLRAGSISLRFNLLDLIRKNYRIKQIHLDDVDIILKVFANGTDNFHFWKESTAASGNNFNFELQRVLAQNLHIVYTNESSKTKVDVVLPDIVARGNFGNSQYTMTVNGNALFNELSSQHTRYISDRSIALSLTLTADNTTGTYKIEEGRIKTGKLLLTAGGKIQYSQKIKLAGLQIDATGSTLEEMISMIPARFREKLLGYDFKGPATLTVRVDGPFGEKQSPSVTAIATLQNCVIADHSTGISFSDISATARYEIKPGDSLQTITVNGLKARFGDGFVNGSLSMTDVSSPHLLANVSANLNLAELHKFLHSDSITALGGRLVASAAFDGNISDISKPSVADFMNSSLNGTGTVQQASLSLKGISLPANGIQLQFVFNGNDLQINKLATTIGKSDFNYSGKLGNFLAWLFVPGQNLEITGGIRSQRLDWDELYDLEQGEGEYKFSLPGDIDINNLGVSAAAFKFRKFKASQIQCNVQMHDKVLAIQDVQMHTVQGRVSGQAGINAQSGKHALLQAKARFEKVNIRDLFTEFGNFGQNEIVDQNLEGWLTADVVFAGIMRSNLEIDANSVKSHCDIMVENGRLVNYTPMQSLSNFLRVEDLADVHFETMQNQIDIANQVIYIPSMQIKSNALNLDLMGTHTFDNEIDYHLTIALADLLTAKFRRKNPSFDTQEEFGPVEKDNRGRAKIYVSVTGTADVPVVKYDKRAIREKFSNDLKTQKSELKQILKQEFNRSPVDSINKTQKQKDRELIKKQEEGNFIIDWDDDRKCN